MRTWFMALVGLAAGIAGAAIYDSARPLPALAQGSGGGTTADNNCYTQRYNADGTKNGNPGWFPCAPNSPMWTINQAQHAVTLSIGNTFFAPTKAILIPGTTPCNISLMLVDDTDYVIWQVQPGILPVRAKSIGFTGTTCPNSAILGLY